MEKQQKTKTGMFIIVLILLALVILGILIGKKETEAPIVEPEVTEEIASEPEAPSPSTQQTQESAPAEPEPKTDEEVLAEIEADLNVDGIDLDFEELDY